VPQRASWKRLAIVASIAAVLATTAAVWSFGQRAALPNTSSRIEFAYRPILSSTQRPFVDITPSGQRILQSAADSNGVIQLTVRDLGSSLQRLIPGAEGALDAVLSPDGEWALYGRQSKLHRISINGGPSTVLVDSINGPADWANDGFVYYTRHDAGLWRIPDVGGVAEQLTTLDTSGVEFNHWLPQLLPGGRAVLFNSYSTPISKSRIEAVDIASGERTVLAEGAVHGRYAASGHLLFARDGAIFAAPFDASALKLRGPAVPVIEGVAWTVTDGVAGYDVADNGTLIYVSDSAWRVQKRIAFVDRAGNETVAIPEAGDWFEPRLSPDERWIAATRITKFAHIWLYDRSRGVLSEFSRGEGATLNALWTPDSRALLHTREVPVYDIYRQDIDGSPPVPVIESRSDKQASSISPDGRLVSYTESITNDAVLLAPFAGGASKRLTPGDAEQRNGSFSPDGKWFAYEEFLPERRSEVYARRLDSEVGRVLVSAGGGTQPRFTRGGREIVYRRGDAMLAASFDPVAGEAGIPTELFRKTAAGRLNGERTVGYDVAADGSKFLLVIPVPRPAALPNIVVTNWFDELSRKVPR
jgi:serine/threonine-protein kinase